MSSGARSMPAGPDSRIGDPVDRLDGRLKVTGAARYSAEWRGDDLAGLSMCAVIVQSRIAKGSVIAVDASAARRLPGVLDVLHVEHAPALPNQGRAGFAPPSGRALSLLQTPDVHYNGEPIGVAIATTFEQATYAADLVEATYASQAGVVDLASAPNIAEPYTQPMLGNAPSYRRGDPDAAIRAAGISIDATYTTPIETHNALEPHATIAHWDRDSLTLYDSTQFLYGVKRFVAKTFGLPDDHVRVVSKFVGGAFGSKGSAWSHVVLAAMAAKAVGRPVRLVLTRRQMFGLVGARPHTVQHMRLAATAAGVLTAIKQDVIFYDVDPRGLGRVVHAAGTRMLYAAPHVSTSQHLARMNIGTPTFNRGPGESSGTFALESAIDELAAECWASIRSPSVSRAMPMPTPRRACHGRAKRCASATPKARRGSVGAVEPCRRARSATPGRWSALVWRPRPTVPAVSLPPPSRGWVATERSSCRRRRTSLARVP